MKPSVFHLSPASGQKGANLAYASHRGVQEELNRLAGEIHDGLAQHLSAICVQLAAAKLLSSRGGDPLCNIQQAIESANLGLAEARRRTHDLRSSVVDESGLSAALQRLARRWTIAGQLRCNFQSNNVPEDRLSSATKHQLLRIAQEAIQNAARHANPTLITLTLRCHTTYAVLEVRDDGLGISAARLKKCDGFGLVSMRKRSLEIDGKFQIRTAPGQGTTITVTAPISS